MNPTNGNTEAVIANWLNNLSEETEIGFATGIRDISNQLNNPPSEFLAIVENPSLSDKIRFSALYGTLVFYWQKSDYIQYRTLVDKYEHIFGEHPLFITFKAQYYGSLGYDESKLTLAVDYACQAVKKTPGLPNVLHLYAALIADLGDIVETIQKNQLIEAERMINRAIALDNGKYAKYFATKARILCQLDRFKEARQNIQKAIELEPSDGIHYTLRLGDYQTIRSNINLSERTKQFHYQQEQSLKRLDEVSFKVVELLGLLAAVIAFLVTGTEMAKGLEFHDAVRLMVVVGGTILIIFSAYSLIFFGGRLRFIQIIVLILGMLLVLTAGFSTFHKIIELVH